MEGEPKSAYGERLKHAYAKLPTVGSLATRKEFIHNAEVASTDIANDLAAIDAVLANNDLVMHSSLPQAS